VENVRSLVLLLRHRGHTVLLTGDLEGAGVDAVTAGRTPAIDILMVPHHGAGGPRVEALAEWAKPRLAVSSQGRTDTGKAEMPYQRRRIPYWATWPDGAVTVRSHASGLTAETFATGQRIVVRPGSGAVP
jgi:competence protein ComEC